MNFNWTELLKSTMVMFAVIDIVGSIPFLLDIKKKAGDIHAERASLRDAAGLKVGLSIAPSEKIVNIQMIQRRDQFVVLYETNRSIICH